MTEPRLVGDEQVLTGHVEPRNDEVIAVFRNGGFEDIYAPGRRLRALWRSYKPGSLTYARILRSDIGFERSVRSVAVSDDWTLPEVRVTAFVALNDANNYAALRQRLLARGLTFMAKLAAELDGEMDRFARRLIGPMTHDQIASQPIPDDWGAAERLLNGLFVVEHVAVTSVTSDPQYDAMVLASRGVRVDSAETRRAAQMARARGLTLDQWENENRHAESHELALAEKLQAVELARIAAETQVARITAESSMKVAAITNIRAVTSAQRGGNGLELTSLRSDTLAVGAGPVLDIHDGEVVPEVEAPTDLGRDPKLFAAWVKAGGSRQNLRGAVHVEDEAGELVVVVVDSAGTSDVEQLAKHAFPDRSSVVLWNNQSVDVWVETIAAARVPDFDGYEADVHLELSDETLTLEVSATRSTAQAIKALTKPGVLLTDALSALLFWDIEIKPAS